MAQPRSNNLRGLCGPHNNQWRSNDLPESLLRLKCWSKGGRPLAAYAAKDHLAAASADRLNNVRRHN